MNKSFYPKLALSNLKRNSKVYVPFIVASSLIITMFFMLYTIAGSEELRTLSEDALPELLSYGTIVIGILSVITLLYTNNFLMKQRTKELGLYNILGMEKFHIGKMLVLETIYTTVTSLVLGLLFGTVFSRLLYFLLLRLSGLGDRVLRNMATGAEVSIEFAPTLQSYTTTALLFLGIFGLILLLNMVRVSLTNPINLLKGSEVGEREPKTKWVMALVGFITLGIAYYLALTVVDPFNAFATFFLAVVLVVIGTYFLFIAGSIVILKQLRKNKKLYYQTKFFVSISGMIYRMKQHAAGLASICILCTMVLVTLSTTVSLYGGMEDSLQQMYPRGDFIVSMWDLTDEEIADLENIVDETMIEFNLTEETSNTIQTLSNGFQFSNGTFAFNTFANSPDGTSHWITFMEVEDYNILSGRNEVLAENEGIIVGRGANDFPSEVAFDNLTFDVTLVTENITEIGGLETLDPSAIYFIVNDIEIVRNIEGETPNEFEVFSGQTIKEFSVNEYDSEQIEDFTETLRTRINDFFAGGILLRTIHETREEFMSFHGGFLFLGIFLGTLFLMVTTLIIYYKQVSEGYEDKKRFEIMQKVGMSKEEVKKSIQNQTLMVFFLPLIMAFIHLAFAFRLIEQMLGLLGLVNTTVFLQFTAMIGVIFAVIYVIVYQLTVRTYYKIVR